MQAQTAGLFSSHKIAHVVLCTWTETEKKTKKRRKKRELASIKYQGNRANEPDSSNQRKENQLKFEPDSDVMAPWLIGDMYFHYTENGFNSWDAPPSLWPLACWPMKAFPSLLNWIVKPLIKSWASGPCGQRLFVFARRQLFFLRFHILAGSPLLPSLPYPATAGPTGPDRINTGLRSQIRWQAQACSHPQIICTTDLSQDSSSPLQTRLKRVR